MELAATGQFPHVARVPPTHMSALQQLTTSDPKSSQVFQLVSYRAANIRISHFLRKLEHSSINGLLVVLLYNFITAAGTAE
jgi:hypothetical protein